MHLSSTLDVDTVIAQTRCWVETFVVGLQLCPFARREVQRGSLRYVVTDTRESTALLECLHRELMLLETDSSIETTLLIHPQALDGFLDYNDFLGDCEALLEALKLDGVYQIASFHPDYQFAGTEPNSAENYTNKSPYPMLHLLRESSVSRAVDTYPDIDAVPDRNIELLSTMGGEELRRMLTGCLDVGRGS